MLLIAVCSSSFAFFFFFCLSVLCYSFVVVCSWSSVVVCCLVNWRLSLFVVCRVVSRVVVCR